MLLRLPEVTRGAAHPVHVLFVCHYNRRRSATAERVFSKHHDLDVRSAGTSRQALVPVNERMLDWADVIFVMEEHQARAIRRAFPAHAALERIVCLEIPDDYTFLDPKLIAVLEERTEPHLARLRARPGRHKQG